MLDLGETWEGLCIFSHFFNNTPHTWITVSVEIILLILFGPVYSNIN